MEHDAIPATPPDFVNAPMMTEFAGTVAVPLVPLEIVISVKVIFSAPLPMKAESIEKSRDP